MAHNIIQSSFSCSYFLFSSVAGQSSRVLNDAANAEREREWAREIQRCSQEAEMIWLYARIARTESKKRQVPCQQQLKMTLKVRRVLSNYTSRYYWFAWKTSSYCVSPIALQHNTQRSATERTSSVQCCYYHRLLHHLERAGFNQFMV